MVDAPVLRTNLCLKFVFNPISNWRKSKLYTSMYGTFIDAFSLLKIIVYFPKLVRIIVTIQKLPIQHHNFVSRRFLLIKSMWAMILLVLILNALKCLAVIDAHTTFSFCRQFRCIFQIWKRNCNDVLVCIWQYSIQ